MWGCGRACTFGVVNRLYVLESDETFGGVARCYNNALSEPARSALRLVVWCACDFRIACHYAIPSVVCFMLDFRWEEFNFG